MVEHHDVLQEKQVLRWGGLSGVLGGLIFIVVFAVVFTFVGDEPATLEGWVTRFPGVRAARTVENGLYLLLLILWIPHFIALQRTLAKSNLAPALFGGVLGVVLNGAAGPNGWPSSRR